MKLIAQPSNLSALLSVLQFETSPQILLPVYQLLSRLIVLPSHRETLVRWSPASSDDGSSQAGPSSTRFAEGGVKPSRSPNTPPASLPYILNHLVAMIADSSSVVRRSAPKALEAALELMAALIKGQPTVAAMLRSWTLTGKSAPVPDLPKSPISPIPPIYSPMLDREQRVPDFFALLQELLATSSTGVRIAAASW